MLEKLELLLKSPIESLGLKLFDLSLSLEKGEKYLRVIIDKPNQRVSLQDIVDVTRLINPLLDGSDFIPEKYTLDVMSLGAEHPIHLEELPSYLHRTIYLHLMHPFEGENMIEGKLVKIDPHRLWIESKKKTKLITIEINRKDIDYARLAIVMK